MNLNIKKITAFAGHFGSGKTNIAINYALTLALSTSQQVSLYDLDIVNPYFRTADSIKEITKAGVKLISSEYVNTNAEGNLLPAEAISAFNNQAGIRVLDIGGDDLGALAIGRYSEKLKNDDFDFFMVINKKRPLCSNAKLVLDNMLAIEHTAKVKFTGIINNTNLGNETTTEIILSSIPFATEISELTGLPIKYTTVKRDLFNKLENKIENIYPIYIYQKPGWDIYN